MLRVFAKLLLLLLAVGAGRLAYDKALDLPPLALKSITQIGNRVLPQDSILAVTGLEMGKSIYKQDLEFAATQLMKEPGAVACKVERGYFSNIKIELTIAEPSLFVNSYGLNGLSREGMVLPLDADVPVLPLVSGRIFKKAACYDRLRDPEIVYALEAHDALMAASPTLCARLSEINFKEDGTLRLYFSPAGTEVLLSKGDIAAGIKRLAALESSGITADTAVFDLRFGPVMIESTLRSGIL